jgi:DNA modification methylase
MEAVAADSRRLALLKRYRRSIRVDPRLDRGLVGARGNRNASGFRWLRYKEAFSAALASAMIERFTVPGGVVLDPFAGVGTALFAARALGRGALGIELLPVGVFAMEARLAAECVDRASFRRRVAAAEEIDWPALADAPGALRHIAITRGAFPPETERALAGYRAWVRRIRDRGARKLFDLAALAVLEDVSYTRKDGQYLRWDGRARAGASYRKRTIPGFGEALSAQLRRIASDLEAMPRASADAPPVRVLGGSCLEVLPELAPASADLVLTSPPYCNRYDYTRTYALELVYLGAGDADVKRLRQRMLSCTVENAGKLDELETIHARAGRGGDCARILDAFRGQRALHEVLAALRAGRLNNPNVPRMVENYFLEMCFVIGEIARVLRPGGRAVMVNDNVRYAGEEIPVDLILGDLAERLGLRVEHIWTLRRGKGNSSQQMGAHGRAELRKCVYVWRR